MTSALFMIEQEIRTDFGRIDCATYVEDTTIEASSDADTILQAFIFAVRAILPLNVFLVLMISKWIANS